MVPAYFDVVRSIFYHCFRNFTGFGGKMTMNSLSKPQFDCGDSGDCNSFLFSLLPPVQKQELSRPTANPFEQEQTEGAEKSQYDLVFLSVSSAISCSKTRTESTNSKPILTGAIRDSREIAVWPRPSSLFPLLSPVQKTRS
jgi:hypothetical protein